ncbi:hypothetical protein LG274_02735 [Micrococcus antarcticus]|uniref:hypothetical protein n=1 Tax=Micrococcus antarcticus TaxID=86171 RepID=UPI00384F847F
MWTPEAIVAIISALGVGGLLSKIVDAWVKARADAARARGETPDARAEAAFYAEQLATLRERCLAAGMSPEDVGPRPVWTPPENN